MGKRSTTGKVRTTPKEITIARKMFEKGYWYQCIPIPEDFDPLYTKTTSEAANLFRLYPTHRFEVVDLYKAFGSRKSTKKPKAPKKVYLANMEITYQVQNKTEGWSRSRNLETAIKKSGNKRLYKLPLNEGYAWRKTSTKHRR